MCIASDSESPDFVFKKAYTRLNRVFTEKYGWPLFLSLTEQDAYNFEILRVPVNNSITEMDMPASPSLPCLSPVSLHRVSD